jgi:hypothetical protein
VTVRRQVEPLATLHPLQDGKPATECIRSWFGAVCPHHPGERAKRPRPQLCALQKCESSTVQNSLERARDAWDGTSGAEDNAARRGLRHFGEVDWGIFIFTLPEQLRSRCTGDKLREFRRAAMEMTVEVLRRHVGNCAAEFYLRSWFHPEGDKNPGTYKPHENVLVPLAWYDPARDKGHRIGKVKLPEDWLGVDGWICEAWRNRLVGVFGRWWRGAPPPTLLWYEWRSSARDKLHALTYFPRTFARWAQHPQVPLRPRSLGLAHWKKRKAQRVAVLSTDKPLACKWCSSRGRDCSHSSSENLLSAVIARCGDPLPPFDDCGECTEEGVFPPPRVAAVGKCPADVQLGLDQALTAHKCPSCAGNPPLLRTEMLDQRERETMAARERFPNLSSCWAEYSRALLARDAESEARPYLEQRRIMRASAAETGPPSTAGPSPPLRDWLNSTTGEVLSGGNPGPGWEACAQ